MEVHAHPSIARTFTPPAVPHARYHSNGSNHKHSRSTFSASSRASDAPITHHNIDTTNAALFQQPAQNGMVSASNNVINRVAEEGDSLFQVCCTLRERLERVPGFKDDLDSTLSMDEELNRDPVSLLWKTFRRGEPLLKIYNFLCPDNQIAVLETFQKDIKREKAAVFKFLNACITQLGFPQDQCFMVSDLFSEDTSGFVKAVRLVNWVVDKLEAKRLIDPVRQKQAVAGQPQKRTQRQHIIEELVRTERTYVSHLKTLLEFKRCIETNNIIAGDVIHSIFLNLGPLLDLQQRFLIRVEQVYSSREDDQDWGEPFRTFGPGFRMYLSYIANQKNSEEAVMKHFERIKELDAPENLKQIVESPTHFTSFLLKPFQRLAKYPLLLKELKKKGNLDEEFERSVDHAISIIEDVLGETNETIARQEKEAAVEQLKEAVDDWKNHSFDGFGRLITIGAFMIQKGDSTNAEREYKLYLFENLLLCCKDVTNKKNKIMGTKATPAPQKPAKLKYTLKGRIYLFNLEDVITISKPGESYLCKITWLANPGVEALTIRFPTEDMMNTWRNLLLQRKEICRVEQQAAQLLQRDREERLRTRSSAEFNFMPEQTDLVNPYKEDDESSMVHVSQYGSRESFQVISNQGSDGSLRSRSTTGESMPPMQRNGKPLNGVPLTLRTQHLQGSNGSFFSPSVESPMSSRTSTSSGVFPFPRQTTPQNAWPEESNRFTAPARPAQQNGYNMADQRNGRAHHQTMPMHQAALAQTRLRSASSPDVHMHPALARTMSAQQPPVPALPPHMAGQPSLSRSQTASPVYVNGPKATYSPDARPRQSSQLRDYSNVREGYGYEHVNPQYNRPQSPEGPPKAFTFKVKIKVPSEGTTFTLVADSGIEYKLLRDRIDAKLQRCTNLSLGRNQFRLQFFAEGEYISIQNDEDVRSAFEDWHESQHRDSVLAGQLGEIVLFCNR